MHRTQILLPPDVYRRARAVAQRKGESLGSLVREALADYLARSAPEADAIESFLLADAYDDPHPEPNLSIDVDHHLYGAQRRVSDEVKRQSGSTRSRRGAR